MSNFSVLALIPARGGSKGMPRKNIRPLAGKPLIKGAIAHLVCDLAHSYPGGDHTLYVGRVTRIRCQAGKPLVYCQGGYRQI